EPERHRRAAGPAARNREDADAQGTDAAARVAAAGGRHMTAHDHDALADLAAPYVLGVLTGAEREAFVAHLDTCALCRQEVASLTPVVEGLPRTLDQAPLPAALRARVLAAATGNEAAVPQPARSRPSYWTGWLAAAATLAAIALGALAWNSRTDAARLRGELATARVREAALDRQIVALQASATYAQQ